MTKLRILTTSEAKALNDPPKLTAVQRGRYFSVNEALSNQLRLIQSPTHKAALLLHYGYFCATGKFFCPTQFRKADIRFVCKLLNIDVKNLALDRYFLNRKRIKSHHVMVLNTLGFKPFDAKAKQLLLNMLSQLVRNNGDPTSLIYHASAQLHQQNIEIPSFTTLKSLISDVINKHEAFLESIIQENINLEQTELLDGLLEIRGNQKTGLAFFKRISQSESPKKIEASVKSFAEKKSLFLALKGLVDQLNLSDHAIEYYGVWVSKAKLSQIKRIVKSEQKYLRLIAFVQHQFFEHHDTLMDLFLKTTQAYFNKAKSQAIQTGKKQKNKEKKAMKTLVSSHDRLTSLVQDITDTVRSPVLTDSGKVEAIEALIQTKDNEQDNTDDAKSTLTEIEKNTDYYGTLETSAIKLANRVSSIVMHLVPDEPNTKTALLSAINHYQKQNGKIDETAPYGFMDAQAKSHMSAMEKFSPALYQSLLFISIANHAKGGSFNFSHSYRYRSINDYLIDSNTWAREKEALIKTAGIEHYSDYHQVIKQLKKVLEDQYASANRHIEEDKGCLIKIHSDEYFTASTPKVYGSTKPKPMRDTFTNMGFVSIIQILMESNQSCGFLEAFKHYAHKNNKLKANPITLIAAIIALGCNIGARKIANISVGVNENNLLSVINWLFSLKNIQSANAKVLAMINRLELPKIYKSEFGGNHTASDGKKINVAVESLLASYAYKYFGNDKGVSAYTFIDETGGLFYSTVMSAAEREATYVIDGILHNNVVKSDVHSTDTHGFSEFIFGTTHLLGVSFAPRIRKFGAKTRYAFHSKKYYKDKSYQLLPHKKINTQIIEDHWDDILRLMVSLKLKKVTASQFFKRLNSYSKEHPLYKAMKEFGRIIKSQYILNYAEDVKLRQRVSHMLNRIELSNGFSDAVFYDRDRAFQVAAPEDQKIATACKTLIQNCIVLWNYLYLSDKLAALTDPDEQDQLLAEIQKASILSWQHVNLQGEFDFRQHAVNDRCFDMKKILAFKPRK